MFTMLTSSCLHYLKICYYTVMNQYSHNLDIDYYIVVNTLNDNYYLEVLNEFKDKNVQIIRTESNGKPGMKFAQQCFTVFSQ